MSIEAITSEIIKVDQDLCRSGQLQCGPCSVTTFAIGEYTMVRRNLDLSAKDRLKVANDRLQGVAELCPKGANSEMIELVKKWIK